MQWLMQTISERHGQKARYFSGRSVFLTLLFLTGVFFGVQMYCHTHGTYRTAVDSMLTMQAVPPSFAAVMAALGNTLLLPISMCILAFLSGISPCGVVIGPLLLPFYGVCVGLSEAQLYGSIGWKGVALTLIVLLPRVLLMLTALYRMAEQCVALSCCVIAQLIPQRAHCGSLQAEFRAYCVHFAGSAGFILASGVWDVLIRMVGGTWL